MDCFTISMKMGMPTSAKSVRLDLIRAPATSARQKRTDCLDTKPSSASLSASLSSHCRSFLPRFFASAGSSLPMLTRLRSSTKTFTSPTTSSLPSTPLPALRITPEVPMACAWSAERAPSSRLSPDGALAMRPMVALRKVLTRSWTALGSHLPASAVFLAFSARTSQVLKALSRTSSESGNSSSGRRFWHVAGRNSAKSSSRAEIRVATKVSASFISSRMVVLRPKTFSPTTSKLMSSSLLSSSSSGRLSGSTSCGRCDSTVKMPGRSAETYGLKSRCRVVAIRPAASWMYSRVGSSGANPACVN
mmetsp:Transcript_27177/g.69013  ORF Transcript_27177/g.69013 Transcript_27177/m.69013 type:complete len:305 (-) Transcript_27177:1933-2847(-)